MKSAANLALHDGKRWECSERHPKVFPQPRWAPPLAVSNPPASIGPDVGLRRKLVIIGDGACGKTSLLSVFTLGYFPTVSRPPYQVVPVILFLLL